MTPTTTTSGEMPSTSRRPYRPCRADVIAAILVLVGVALRIALALRMPVGYDEVFVMALGLEDLLGSAGAFVVEVPVTRSTAVTPLWWWLQAAPQAIAGEVSLVTLRVVPVVLGCITPLLAWLVARRSFGRGPAAWFTAMVALSDVLIFTNSRGEFAESFTVPLIVLCVGMVGRRGMTWRRGLAWSALLLAALVKGLLVVGLVVAAEVAIALTATGDRRRRIIGLAASVLIAVVPVAAYLVAAQAHFAGGTIEHEALAAPNVIALVGRILFDYSTVKAHVTGGIREGVFVFTDAMTWPVMALTAPLLLLALGGAVLRLHRLRWRPRSRRDRARLGLAVWAVAGAAIVIGKGAIGARFHLLYLPAWWMLAGLWLAERRTRWSWASIAGMSVAWAALVGLASSWVDWEAGVLSASRWCVISAGLTVLAMAALRIASSRRCAARTGLGIAIGVCALASWWAAGPMTWAPASRFEPMPQGRELAAVDAVRRGESPGLAPHGRTLHIDLANYHLTAQPVTEASLQRALHHARIEVRTRPGDARAWAYLGEALYRLQAPREEIEAAWARSQAIAPNDRLRQRLEQLRAGSP